MKRILVGIACVLLQFGSYAQEQTPAGIGWIDKLPLLIQANTFYDSLLEGNTLLLVSPRCTVSLLGYVNGHLADRYFQLSNRITGLDQKELEFRVTQGNSTGDQQGEWRQIPQQIAALPLLDTVLAPASEIRIQFRVRSAKNSFQQIRIRRSDRMPIVSMIRPYLHSDLVALPNTSPARAVPADPKQGFVPFTGNTITIAAGSRLQCFISDRVLNRDSCLQYRLLNTESRLAAGWKTTGHTLTLDALAPGNTYLLEIQYEGAGLGTNYTVTVLPHWYQTTKWIIVMVVAGACMLVLASLFFFRYRLAREREDKNRVREQLQRVQSQLNPHFVYNALSSIEGLVAAKHNDRANEYLNHFSQIMRETVNNSNLIWTSLAQDLAMLDKYIRLEQLRFEFRYRLLVDTALDLHAIEFPPMLLQPTVENAVRHGISGMGHRGILEISFTRQEHTLVVSITDNGNGSSASGFAGTGNGIRFTRQRIGHLRKLFPREKITYHLTHSPGGTKAVFCFENWL